MTIKRNQLSFFEYILNPKEILYIILFGFIVFVLMSFVLSMIFENKMICIIVGLLCAIIVSIVEINNNTNVNYYSINGSAKVIDMKPYSTNGNSDDNDTQTIYFAHNNHVYNIQFPDNTLIKKGDTINIKSSKYGASIDNGTIKESNIINQTLDVKLDSKN